LTKETNADEKQKHLTEAQRLFKMRYVPPHEVQETERRNKKQRDEKIDHIPAYHHITQEVKGLITRDVFFANPGVVDSNLINAYQDHLLSIEEFLNILKGAGPFFKKDAGQVVFMRLRTIMRDMKEKVLDLVTHKVKEGRPKRVFIEQCGRWNDQVKALEEVGKALDDQRYNFEYIKFPLPSPEEKTN